MNPFRSPALLAALMIAPAAMSAQQDSAAQKCTAAQVETAESVDDSPAAWELFRQAQDQVENNTAEAVRLFQELLDEHPLNLIPIGESSPDHLRCTRQRVLRELRGNPELLRR